MALPLIPFASLPRREYKKGPVTIGGEIKPRLDLTKVFHEGDEDEYYEEEEVALSDSDSSSSSSEYDLLQHLADLLPGDLENGMKPTKEANNAHLADLKVVKRRPDRLKYVKYAYRYVMTMRARERERRKHYIIKEYERKIKEFDELQKKMRDDAMAEEEKAIRLEEEERQQRIIRNSRKKKDKMALNASFQKSIAQREKEAQRLNYYCANLPGWSIEGMYKEAAAKQAAEEKRRAHEAILLHQQEEAAKQAIIARDQAIFDEDKQITEQVEDIMVRYGMIHYDHPPLDAENARVEHILSQHRKQKKKQKKQQEKQQEKQEEQEGEEEMGGSRRRAVRISEDDSTLVHKDRLPSITSHSSRGGGRGSSPSRPSTSDSTASGSIFSNTMNSVLDLTVSKSANLHVLQQELHRTRFKGTGYGKNKKGGNAAVHRQVEEPANAFPDINFDDTGDIRIVRGHHLRTLGILAFASELARGACPFLEEAQLAHCDMRDQGVLRLFQGLRLGSITGMRVMDLRGNALSSLSLDYFRDICTYGIFANLEELNLSQNELGDAGIEAILRVLLLGHFMPLRSLVLQRNSITNQGFVALMTMMVNVHDRFCPHLSHLALGMNLVSAECKQRFSPLPDYVSV